MSVVAFSDVFMLLDSMGVAWEDAGEVLAVLSWERPSFCIDTPVVGFDFELVAVEKPDGFDDPESWCESSAKKLAARTPPTANTPITSAKKPKRRFFF